MSKAARRLAEIPGGSWTKWLVMGFWVAVLVVAFPLSAKLTHAEKNDASTWLPASAESVKALNVQARFQPPNTYPGVVVYYRGSGLTAADRAKAAADARRFAGIAGVVPGTVTGPVSSADGKAMQTLVSVNVGTKGWNGAATAVDAMRAIAGSGANGLASHVAGYLGTGADSSKLYKGIDGTLLYAAVAVVIVILLITYRSPVLWLLPVISSGVALITAEAVVYLLAAHAGLTVNQESQGILLVLVFGASTDYALLIVARYREELRRHDRRHPAMAEALRRAGPAIIASAGTVVIALLMLSFAQLGSTKGMGPVLAVGVAVGAAAMLTLLPALLVIFPRGVFWPYRPGYGSAEPTTRPVGAGRLGHRPAAAAGLGHHRRAAGCHGAGAGRPEGRRPDQRAVLPRPPRLRRRGDGARRPLPGRSGRTRHHHRQSGRGHPAAGRLRRHPRHRPRDRPSHRGGIRLPAGHADRSAG